MTKTLNITKSKSAGNLVYSLYPCGQLKYLLLVKFSFTWFSLITAYSARVEWLSDCVCLLGQKTI